MDTAPKEEYTVYIEGPDGKRCAALAFYLDNAMRNLEINTRWSRNLNTFEPYIVDTSKIPVPENVFLGTSHRYKA